MPATGALIGTPASIKASVEAHTLPIEVLPFELSTSDTSRIVYAKSFSSGMTATSAFSASAPCPIYRLPVEPILLTSPVENGGKL